MSRIKSIFAVLCLAAIVGIVPRVQAQTQKVVIVGSSALWQTMALGAYNGGVSIVSAADNTCHFTSSGKFNLIDTRSSITGGSNTTDTGNTWIVWDYSPTGGANCTTGTPINYWVFITVDSVVGNRCYFAAPKCTVSVGAITAAGNQINQELWGDNTADTVPPSSITTLFTTGSGLTVTVAATDIRPEDANFASCRVNSPLGGAQTGTDGLDGLGYSQAGATQLAGDCFKYTTQAQGVINGVGKAILSGFPGSSSKANVLSFSLPTTVPKPVDPITGTALQTAYTVTPVGAAPIIFVTARAGSLANLTTATEQQLQQVFSGQNCNASAFGSSFSGALNVFLREPLSGTYNTAEATVFRYPTIYPGAVEGVSQEKGVTTNALNQVCASGGGKRYRAIGTGQEVQSVFCSNSTSASSCGGGFTTQQDGIGYLFFSYGNVSPTANPINDNPNYGYIKLNGIDPIWAAYGAGTSIDPAEAVGAGTIPGEADLPGTCLPVAHHFPCSEHLMWGNGFSFPNLRNGTYRSWSLLRVIATGTPSTNVVALVKASNKYVVNAVPDYVPATAVAGTTDLGLKLLRSHYQQKDGSNPPALIGPTPGTLPDTCNVPEKGGDMGGMIIPTTIGVTTEKQCQMVQSGNPDGDLSPAIRP